MRRPPEVTPGNPLHFASAWSLEGYATGLIVESHAGRPTKVEGNPDHPDSQGATGSYEQALPLGLYDDERGKAIRHQGRGMAWRSLLAVLARQEERYAADKGAKLRFLVEPSGSPLLADLRSRIQQKLPQAKFVAFSPVAADGVLEGARLVFGRPLEPRHDLTQARVIVSLDADFCERRPGERSPVPPVRRGPRARAEHEPPVRRRALPDADRQPGGPPPARAGLADRRRGPGPDRPRRAGSGRPVPGRAEPVCPPPAAGAAVDGRWINAVAKDLLANKGRAWSSPGGASPRPCTRWSRP